MEILLEKIKIKNASIIYSDELILKVTFATQRKEQTITFRAEDVNEDIIGLVHKYQNNYEQVIRDIEGFKKCFINMKK